LLFWSLVDSGTVSLHELRTHWSLDDVARCVAAKSYKADIEAMVQEAIEKT
jgi:hypothetical protein